MTSLLFEAHPLEGWFFGSGKAYVVLAVAAIILVLLGGGRRLRISEAARAAPEE